MANICGNWVEINGDEEQVKEFIELVGKDFDFNKIVPIKDDSEEEAAKHWGCNSIAFDTIFDSDDGCANWYFWTKWNPPYEIYKALTEKFSNVNIYWRYEEPGCDLYGFLQNELIKEDEKPEIIVSIKHGLVTDVEFLNAPKDITLVIKDYDITETEEGRTKTDEDGDYEESLWSNE